MPTLTNKQLHQLLKPVIPFAYKDADLTILNSVRIEPLNGKLSAHATDRFRIGRVRLDEVDADGFAATLPLKTAKWLLSVFQVKDKFNEVHLTLNDPGKEGLAPTVTVSGGTVWGPNVELCIDQAGVDMGTSAYPARYPDLAKLYNDAAERPVTGSAAFNGQYLADMAGVPVNALGASRGPVRVSLSDVGQRKAALFFYEDDAVTFTGLLMPVNFPGSKDDI